MMKEQYSTFEAAKIIGVKRERFRAWYTKGFLRHRIIKNRHVFTLMEVEEAYAFKLLVDNGLTRKKAKQLVKKWRAMARWDYIVLTVYVGGFAEAVRRSLRRKGRV